MSRVRQPAVAGMFYPDDPAQLRQQIKDLLDQAEPGEDIPKAIIAPHAGYIYSGSIAANAYAQLKSVADRIRRVVLLGPSHRVPFHGLAAPSTDTFRTPLGDVALDTEALAALERFPQVQIRDDAHAWEHSLEVQLPFLQTVLPNFKLIPLVVGDATYEEVSEVLDSLWGDEATLVVISSDLSHYHDYDTAVSMDRATSVAIEALAPERIEYDHACGRTPVGGLLLAARQRGLHAHTIDLRNSGDTAGPRDQVVGYGAYVVN